MKAKQFINGEKLTRPISPEWAFPAEGFAQNGAMRRTYKL
jgi:hypothetical protein